MIFGLGTDLIEVSRIKKAIERSDSFKRKIFNQVEIDYCDSLSNPYQSYAARFAAKEAFMKALGTGWRDGLSFNTIYVVNDELGKPSMKLECVAAQLIKKNDISSIHVSLTHIKEIASVTIILEK